MAKQLFCARLNPKIIDALQIKATLEHRSLSQMAELLLAAALNIDLTKPKKEEKK